VIALVLAGCKADQRVVAPPTDTGAPPPTSPPTTPPETTPVDTSLPTSDTDPPTARAPIEGELVIDELMIDPLATGDSHGEWVELLNASADALDLTGLELADDSVDDALITELAPGSLVVAPGSWIALCADGDPLSNGGVTCGGTYLYSGFGGGLALANESDELEIRLAADVIDRFAWLDGFAVPGQSLGLDPDFATETGNDDPAAWCPQTEAMSGGDLGNPGAASDGC
jgi:hypothetical protein